MTSVIQSSWFIFLLCAGALLLLVGCATLGTRTSTQDMTDSPLVTLTVVPFSIPATLLYSTPQAVETDVWLPPPEWRANRSSSTGIGLNDPTCYNSPNQGFMCLGQVRNQTGQMLSNITLRVALFGDSGQVVAEQIIGLDQHYLPPQISAPYRAQFSQLDTRNPTAMTDVEHLIQTVANQVPLRITNEQGRLVDSGRYVFTANLHNTGTEIAQRIRLIVTVLDDDNRVVGYRVQSLAPLSAGAEQPVHMEIIPQVIATKLHHLLYIESFDSK